MAHLAPLAVINEPVDFIKLSQINIDVGQENYLQFIPAEIEKEFEGWQVKETKRIEQFIRNIVGAKLSSFEFSLCFFYGGKYHGRGNYLKCVKILVSNINALPPWTVNARIKHISSKNLINDTENVDLSVTLEVEAQFKNFIQTHTRKFRIEVNGNGEYTISKKDKEHQGKKF